MAVSISPSYMRRSVYDPDADNVVDRVEGAKQGTSFPDDPSNGYLFFRTDLGELYIYEE